MKNTIILPKRTRNKTRFLGSIEIKPHKRIRFTGLRFNNAPKECSHNKLQKVERIVEPTIDWGDFPAGSKFKIRIRSAQEYRTLKKTFSVPVRKIKYGKQK